MAIHLGPKAKLAMSIGGFFVGGVLSFLVFLQLTFPYDRVKDRLIDKLSPDWEVSIGKVKRGFLPGNVTFEKVSLTTRKKKPNDIQSTLYLQSLEVELGILGLLGKSVVVEFDANVAGKHLTGEITASASALVIKANGERIQAKMLPTREYTAMPIGGLLTIKADLTIPLDKKQAMDWPKAKGFVAISCPANCTVGDGTKVKFPTLRARDEAMMGDGIPFAAILIDSFKAKFEFIKGVAKVTQFDLQSQDGQADFRLALKLDKNFSKSIADGCVRYKVTDELRKRAPDTHGQITLIGGKQAPDGMFDVALSDQVGRMKKIGKLCSNGGESPGDPAANGDRKPNLTLAPEEEKKDVPVPTPLPTPAPAPAPVVEPVPAPAPQAGSGSAANGQAMGAAGTVPAAPVVAPAAGDSAATGSATPNNVGGAGAGSAGAGSADSGQPAVVQ